jgi:hypothetical protein
MTGKHNGLRRLVVTLCCAAPIAVCLAIWLPEFIHYHVPEVRVSDEMLEIARLDPSDAVLDQLQSFCFLPHHWNGNQQLVDAAVKLLHGQVEIPELPRTKIKMPFDPKDMDRGPLLWQLDQAALVVPEVLLEAYSRTRQEEFFRSAQDVILSWADYEDRAWAFRGYLWNDHALAERVTVLAKFWRVYRHRPDYDPRIARAVLRFAARSGEFLAKSSHFTFATNHGVMQNLALWHLCLAFPTLPHVVEYRRLAFDRLREQMHFYVNSEGVVLEDSPHYHKFGVELLGMAFRYLALLKESVPPEWKNKYEAASKFYVQLKRPDGSLPMLGDTDADEGSFQDPVSSFLDVSGAQDMARRPIPEPYSLYPAAGYAIWWDGLDSWPDSAKLGQTVASWSHYSGHGHNDADELSVLLWSNGQTWWTNTGYWPYGVEGRRLSEGWAGSDAPHLVGELVNSERSARLLCFGKSDNLNVLEMERTGPNDYSVRRFLLHWKPNIWVVLDQTNGGTGSRTTTTWTTAANVLVRKGNLLDSFLLEAKESGRKLLAVLIFSQDSQLRMLSGSLNPFAGWQVGSGVPQKTTALMTEQPAQGSWSAMIWVLNESNTAATSFSERPELHNGPTGDEWQISLPLKSGALEIRRNAATITVWKGRQSTNTDLARMVAPPDVSQLVQQVQEQYRVEAMKYPPFRDLLRYRWRATYLVLLMVLLEEVFFLVYRTWWGRFYFGLRALSICGWAGLGVWLILFYLQKA